MRKRAKARENELLAKVSPKDIPISFSSKDGCLKRSYGGRGGLSYYVTGMLVISLRSVNRRFWSHSGCLGRKSTLFVHAGVA